MTIDTSAFNAMDHKVHDWLAANLGPVIAFERQPRWRPGWDVVVERDGAPLGLYVRGPRGDSYVSPVDMHQEAQIHRAFERHGIPAPRLLGMIDDPLAMVLERLAGRINSATIADPLQRQRIREDFIAIIARQHQLPPEAFAAVGLTVPQTAEEIALGLYAPAEAIFRANIGRPFPLMRFIGGWLRRNVPFDRTRAAFINPDAGQFLFDDTHVTGLIDFEVSSFGDPAAELAGLRLRNAAEPLGDIGALIDHYELLTGDKISKQLIEYHSAGFCGVNGFLLWPLAFNCSPEQDYVAYMHYAVWASRASIKAIAEHSGVVLAEPAEPELRPLGFSEAARHLVRHIGAMRGGTPVDDYARDAGAALALYLQHWNDFGPDVVAANLADASALVGRPLTDWDEAQAAVEAFVAAAGPQDDARLVQHFHNWLRRQDFLLRDCGQASFLVGGELQPIAAR